MRARLVFVLGWIGLDCMWVAVALHRVWCHWWVRLARYALPLDG
jgi:hypothetical protein